MILLLVLVVAVGGLVEIAPLCFQKSTTEPVIGVMPTRRCSSPAATSFKSLRRFGRGF